MFRRYFLGGRDGLLLMGSHNGFRDLPRSTTPSREPLVRLLDYNEFAADTREGFTQRQGERCMDCGVPFCMSATGCPLGNLIPEWNDLIYEGRWLEAAERLDQTNNFPEFTGRVCPAPCEGSCCASVYESPVAIKNIEQAIADRAWNQGWVTPRPPTRRTGKHVAVVGSGPAGLAAAQQLNRAGHRVTVYERHDRVGGLLIYGIPNMKLDKAIVQRRVDQLIAEGVEFVTRAFVGGRPETPAGAAPPDEKTRYLDPRELLNQHDALLLATGSTRPRDLPIPGRDLDGVYFAMQLLHANTQKLVDSGQTQQTQPTFDRLIDAKDKHVIVIGGGDTGNDCLGTSLRHGCKSLVNFELLAKPPAERSADNPWPQWPKILRTDYGHQEAIATFGQDPREFGILSKAFLDDGHGHVCGVRTVRVDWTKPTDKAPFSEVPGSEQNFEADLVLLAMGFLGPEAGPGRHLGITNDARGNYQSAFADHRTNVEKIFVAGDCRRGQSLIVWAIAEGRRAAESIDQYLTASPTKAGKPHATLSTETATTSS